jgi:anti-anti-sigma factor
MALAELSPLTVPCGVAFVGRDDDRIVVWLRGEHDVSTQVALSETMAGAFALDDADVVIDLSGVEFMGAATVGVIVRAGEFLRLRSRCLVLRAPSTCARRILDLCGLAGLLEPRPVDVTRVMGTAGALGTWVAVPATDRFDRRADSSAPRPSGSTDRVPAGRLAAARKVSAVDAHHLADKHTTTVAGRVGP